MIAVEANLRSKLSAAAETTTQSVNLANKYFMLLVAVETNL